MILFIIYQVYMRGSSCLKWEGFEAFFIYLVWILSVCGGGGSEYN